MKKNRTKVTVLVVAYNEEQNIISFLRSVISQDQNNYLLERIIVVSDGSKDRTAFLVSTLKDSRIVLEEYSDRMGKSYRLNQIYSCFKGDILVQSDADVILSHSAVIDDLIHPMILDKKVKMCGGNAIPLKGSTFTENAINLTTEVYIPLRTKIRDGIMYSQPMGDC